MSDKWSKIFDFTSAKLTYYSSFSFLSFLSLSERDEKGKFFPERGDENFETASLFCNSSNSFILRFTFLFVKSISDIAASIFVLFYLGFLPSYWIKLRGLDSVIIDSTQGFMSLENLSNTTGLHLTLTSCFLIVASDIGSYFIGKSFGKTSLSPISPSKTIEGLIGGISCSILLAIFFAFLMNWENPLFVGIIYGISISLMALVGDLIESMMKRDAKIKDSGTFLPGHGGILDRIDSYIFTPSVLYYIFIILKYLN